MKTAGNTVTETDPRRRRRGVRVVVASGVVVDGVVVIARRTLMARVAGVTRGIRVALVRVVTRVRFLCALSCGAVVGAVVVRTLVVRVVRGVADMVGDGLAGAVIPAVDDPLLEVGDRGGLGVVGDGRGL